MFRWWSDHNAGFIVRHRRYGLCGYASFAVSCRLVCHTWQACMPHLAGLCATPGRFVCHAWQACVPHLAGLCATPGRLVCHTWKACVPHLAGLCATLGSLVCHTWQACVPHLAGILYLYYKVTRSPSSRSQQ